jgi:small-conductance mechanosensitive channel
MNEVFDQVVFEPLRLLFHSIQVFLPRIFWAMGVLLIGYLIGVFLRQTTHYLLWAVGMNMASERAGISAFLRRGQVDRQPSELIGSFLFWVVMFSAFMIALYHLGLTAAETLLLNLFLYVPQGLAALFIVIVGLFLAGFTSRLVKGTVAAANIRAASLLAYGTRVVIVMLACFIALEKLDVGLGGLMAGMVVVLVSIPVGLVLAFSIGGRQFIQDLIAGQSLTHVLSPGDEVSVGEHRGTITEVGLTATTIQTLVGDVVMSNSVLAAQIVLVRSRIPRPEPTPETTAQATEGPEALESREEIRSPEPSPSPEITATPTAAK